MCVCEIRELQPPAGRKAGQVLLAAPNGQTRLVKFWPTAPFAAMLKVGEKADAKIEVVTGRAKQDGTKWPDEPFLKSWNGVGERPDKKQYGPRGKSETEILAQLAAAAVNCPDPQNAFDTMLALVNSGKGKLL